ncbi:hypothetical protein [Parerythrobacter jejuensis]|uniref:Uncharacterized protein n=1 Tax=Parerythrobacter jejuensis TaxID=795812 RepID=A0A845AWU1_9SPHN|nr:hypothetical protein [Parerythrobacter jejuensis]MXP30997.1 hypothetical protein [Parerythrobacter jejuensis]MXP33757.1 hypothetical protein [Parerythrobacter jejuensis]
MSVQFADLARAVAEDGRIAPDEILSLRRLGWGDGIMTREEAEAIFAINRQITLPGNDWVDFFVEAIGEFVLNGTDPKGMCDEREADWLIRAFDHDGKLETMAELETLVRIIERARNVPDALKHYTLEQIEQAVLYGEGPTRCGGDLSATHLSAAECALLRRVIFASGGHGPAAVSRFDAEMLFRIKDATLDATNAPEWQDLFVDGTANYLRGFSAANAQLSHNRTKELEGFIADNSVNVGRFFGRMAKEAPKVANHFGKVFGQKRAGTDPTLRAIEGEIVTENEQNWLDSMIEADGKLDPLEKALIARVEEDLN